MEENNDDILRPSEKDTTQNIISEYTVEERDTISDIENKFNLTWKEIVEANRNILEHHEDITAGLRLKIPSKNA